MKRKKRVNKTKKEKDNNVLECGLLKITSACKYKHQLHKKITL